MAKRLCGIVLCSMSVVVFLASLGVAAERPDPAALLAPYVNDDTFVAGYLNLAALPEKDAREDAQLFGLLPFMGEEREAWSAASEAVEQYVAILRRLKVHSVYVIAGLGDVNSRGGPIVVFHLGVGGRPDELVRTFAPIAPFTMGQWKAEVELRPHGANTVLFGTRATVERYTSLAKSDRTDLLGPLAKLSDDGAVVATVFCPGPDFRRVVRELWPELPGPLAPLRGELADRWLHVELAANLPPDAKPRLALRASDSQAAETSVSVLRALPAAAEQLRDLGERRHELKRQLEMILDALPPKQDGERVAITLPTDEAQLAMLQPLFAGAADAALESSRRRERMNQFKQLGIAMQNYYDVNKHLPASAAIRDKEGRPLLSWRVAILPYIDENDLFKQFHLDEPWDSPHNRALIEKMPAIYADPDSKLKPLAREGKTTFQVPVGPETAFYNNEGTSFREVADGTSKTILVVEVEPLRAVVWTKPEDWEVDMQHPRRGVERTDRNHFVAGYADAHVSVHPLDIDEKTLRALLTRAGREVVDQP